MKTLMEEICTLMDLVDGKIIGVVSKGFDSGLRVLTYDGRYVEIWLNDYKIDNG